MKRFTLLHILLLLAVVLSGCGEAGPARTQVWIDVPLNGAEVEAGTIPVQSHAASRNGIAHVELWVNGTLYRSDENPTPDEPVIFVIQPWIPTAPGDYTLEVRAYSTDDTASAPESVTVHVTGEVAEVTETPTAEFLTPTPVPPTDTSIPPTDTPIPPTYTPVPPTYTPVPPTFTPVPPTFTPIPPTYTPIPPTFTPIPPSPTPTIPPDTTGPTISDITASDDMVLWPPIGCTPDEVTISASVFDSSGVYVVKLVYRVVDEQYKRDGEWQALAMNQTATAIYVATVGAEELERSLNPPTNGSTVTLEYYVQAYDTYNNRSESSTGTIDVGYCLL
ncbi:MAG: Ig-like domain-containing protein [Anaerolineae bacterium]